jgi:hypothetical protein
MQPQMNVHPRRILPGRNPCEPGGSAYGATNTRKWVGTLLKTICVHLRVSAVASSWLEELKTWNATADERPPEADLART